MSDASDSESSKLVSVRDAYIAMYRFVDAYWERGGRRDGNVSLLRHAIAPTLPPNKQGAVETNDPASWDDWLSAVQSTLERGFPPVD